jgi:Ribonuclease G/E
VTREIRAACSPGEIRVAVTENDRLVDYAIWRPGAPDGVGDVHRGRIIALVPAMAGAFVAIAGDEGFLPDSDGAAGRTEGDILVVRVIRAPQGGKGPRLSGRVEGEVAEGAAPTLLHRGPGALERLGAEYPDTLVLIDDPGVAAGLRPVLGARMHVVPTAFDDELEAEVAALAEPTVALAGGGALHIQPTRALVAIDIDTGSRTGERQGKTRAQQAGNRAMLPELARQIRLRNLAGAILVDFAGLSPKRRAALAPELAAALREDKLRPRLLGFTNLGLAEIVRPRVHPPLHELLAGSHAACLAALRAMAREEAANPARPLVLRAAPAVISALDAVAKADYVRRTGRALATRADPSLPADGWNLE